MRCKEVCASAGDVRITQRRAIYKASHKIRALPDVHPRGGLSDFSFDTDCFLDALKLVFKLLVRRVRRADPLEGNERVVVPIVHSEPARGLRQGPDSKEQKEWNDVEDGELNLIGVLREVALQRVGDDCAEESADVDKRLEDSNEHSSLYDFY